uniref:Uncharacterized protein n=1 Tax=Anguilla anguilla TaxID=7936 RepID=A0A0E9UDM9_ANGAN
MVVPSRRTLQLTYGLWWKRVGHRKHSRNNTYLVTHKNFN